ncbi:hypothetical protein AMATHDRAFT_70631 [Amanita thiersii Skay4041]|uniref:Uncharacterized protein n=1 Tax=Amanita thiersii Skay4041 TaxID=703135 RepID=A0A2A9NCW5_9AGAR|nr:hypothetical protein AMATHDRAFT_70631 [Amanita thiersii Skay4041]
MSNAVRDNSSFDDNEPDNLPDSSDDGLGGGSDGVEGVGGDEGDGDGDDDDGDGNDGGEDDDDGTGDDDDDDDDDECLASVTIAGTGGGKRRFWRKPNGAIRIRAWRPNGRPWGKRVLVQADQTRESTPFDAVCWGGNFGFRQIRLYYVGKDNVLEEMTRPNGGRWRKGNLGKSKYKVGKNSSLLVIRTNGRTRVRFTNPRGEVRVAVSGKEGWSLQKPPKK